MWSACLDEYQHAVGRHYDLFLFGGNRWVLVLAQGFLDLLLDFEQGGVQRGGLRGDFGEVQAHGQCCRAAGAGRDHAVAHKKKGRQTKMRKIDSPKNLASKM